MKLNCQFPINTLSYGYCGISILRELVNLGLDTALIPIGQIDVETQEDANLIDELVNQRLVNHFNGGKGLFFHEEAPIIKLWHQHDLMSMYAGSPRIGFPIFELNKFSDLEKKSLQSCDYLFVPSTWAKNIILDQLGETWEDKIDVVPLGTNPDIFFPVQQERNEKFTILNMGKMEIRKGLDIIPEIVNKAFKPTDDVELWMAVDNPFLNQTEINEWVNFYLDTPLGKAGKIKFIPRLRTQQEVAALFNKVDVGLFPTRSEGWGLPILDMMACGKTVITTNYGGSTEFTSNNPTGQYLINIDNLEPAYDGKWFFGDGEWAHLGESQINEFIAILVNLYKNWQNNDLKVNLDAIETSKAFSWKYTAADIMEITKKL